VDHRSQGAPFSAVKPLFAQPREPGGWGFERRATALGQLALVATVAGLSVSPLSALARCAVELRPCVADKGSRLMLVNRYGDDSGLMSLPPELQRYALPRLVGCWVARVRERVKKAAASKAEPR
jgi:hypothetical protein